MIYPLRIYQNADITAWPGCDNGRPFFLFAILFYIFYISYRIFLHEQLSLVAVSNQEVEFYEEGKSDINIKYTCEVAALLKTQLNEISRAETNR